jgi:hypothetical protein
MCTPSFMQDPFQAEGQWYWTATPGTFSEVHAP